MVARIQTGMLLLLCLFFTTMAVADNNTPVGLLQFISNNMIAGLKSHQATLKSKPQTVYDLAYKYVVPYADLTEMSKRVLPPHVWNSASAAQRAQFQKEFTTLLVRTYASALASYRDQTIQFYPPRDVSGATVEVNSQIKSSQRDPIRVTYRLLRNGNNWKLFDMSVEGVSLISSFRSQFANILAQGNMEQLLRRLSKHNMHAKR